MNELRGRAPIPVCALAAAPHEELQSHLGASTLNSAVCLLWYSGARRISDASSSLSELMMHSRTQAGYCPNLVQEVLINAYGSQLLLREVLDPAATLRASAVASVNPPAPLIPHPQLAPPSAPVLPAPPPPPPPQVSRAMHVD